MPPKDRTASVPLAQEQSTTGLAPVSSPVGRLRRWGTRKKQGVAPTSRSAVAWASRPTLGDTIRSPRVSCTRGSAAPVRLEWDGTMARGHNLDDWLSPASGCPRYFVPRGGGIWDTTIHRSLPSLRGIWRMQAATSKPESAPPPAPQALWLLAQRIAGKRADSRPESLRHAAIIQRQPVKLQTVSPSGFIPDFCQVIMVKLFSISFSISALP